MLEESDQYQCLRLYGLRQVLPRQRKRKLGIPTCCWRESPRVAQLGDGKGELSWWCREVADGQFYILPEGYLVSDPSLNDILHVLNPRFKSSDLTSLSQLPKPSYALNSKSFLPGYVGMNNMKEHDYLNVILQLFLHVPPIRTFFLDPAALQLQDSARPTELVKRLAALCRRLWNPKLFKAQVSPHEFLQEVTKRSAGKFRITERGDPVEFLGWLVNTLHRDLGGSKKRGSSVIYSTFQGKVQIETQQVITHKEYSRPIFDVSRGKLATPAFFSKLTIQIYKRSHRLSSSSRSTCQLRLCSPIRTKRRSFPKSHCPLFSPNSTATPPKSSVQR